MKKYVIFILGLFMVSLGVQVVINMAAKSEARRTDALQQEILTQQQQQETLTLTRTLIQEVILLRAETEELRRQLERWLETWEVDTWEATAYAPLDPAAIEGACYSGDPNITASGQQVKPGVTAAAGPDIEFGTPVYVVGDGPRIVQDRGGRIGSGSIDLAVETREEALKFGRQPVKVVYQR